MRRIAWLAQSTALVLAASVATFSAEPDGLLLGADVSALDRLDTRGVAYFTDGEPRTALGILEEAGFDVLRLRVLVEPATGYLGLERSAAMGARLKGAGFRLLVSLRCADAEEGAGAGEVPRRWRALPPSDLAPVVRRYVRDAVSAFRVAGAPPDLVQIGHDISRGFLGDAGRIAPDSSAAAWDRFATLLGAALAGARTAAPRARTVLPLEGGDPAWCAAVVDSLKARGVAFDVIGVTWVPWFHGTIAELRETLQVLAGRAEGGVLVLETAYPWTLRGFDDALDEVGQPSQLHPGYPATPDGQRRWFADVIALVRETPGGVGLLWGDPISIAARGVPSSRENLALFDDAGRALPALWLPRKSEAD